MPSRARREVLLHRILALVAGWIFAAAVYLLLIDITDLPELIVGSVAALLAAAGFELAREQEIVGGGVAPSWARRGYRPFAKVPRDIALVSLAAIRQLARRERACGEFRRAPFATGPDQKREVGRRALAESLGSFAPNTIVIGVDADRELILAHQLHATGGREAVDVLELG